MSRPASLPRFCPHYVNDCILRCIAGLTTAERPEFLKIAYNGPKAMEELASFDPSVIVGVLGGGAGTTRDTFELLHQAEKYGARVALFGPQDQSGGIAPRDRQADAGGGDRHRRPRGGGAGLS